jgi:putative transcriptional regulator
MRIREITKLNRNSFAIKYGIPYRTVQDWELGNRRAPDYVLDLLERAVQMDAKEWK